MFGTRTQETSFFTAFDRRLSILTTRLLGLLFGLLGNHFSALLWVNTKVQKTQEKTACQLGDRCARGVPCGKEWLKIRFLEVHPRAISPKVILRVSERLSQSLATRWQTTLVT